MVEYNEYYAVINMFVCQYFLPWFAKYLEKDYEQNLTTFQSTDSGSVEEITPIHTANGTYDWLMDFIMYSTLINFFYFNASLCKVKSSDDMNQHVPKMSIFFMSFVVPLTCLGYILMVGDNGQAVYIAVAWVTLLVSPCLFPYIFFKRIYKMRSI